MTDEEITEFLFVREPPVAADLGLVFSCARLDDGARRARHRARLHREGFVPRLLLTGGGLHAYGPEESRTMLRAARDEDVPESALLVEPVSSSTFENVSYSLDLLRARGLLDGIRTVLLVTCGYHSRRVLLTARKLFPPGIRLVSCPPENGCAAETWTASETCRRRVLEELTLLEAFLEAGFLSLP